MAREEAPIGVFQLPEDLLGFAQDPELLSAMDNFTRMPWTSPAAERKRSNCTTEVDGDGDVASSSISVTWGDFIAELPHIPDAEIRLLQESMPVLRRRRLTTEPVRKKQAATSLAGKSGGNDSKEN